MRWKKTYYNIINIIVIGVAFLFLGNLVLNNMDIIDSISSINNKIVVLMIGITLFFVIHILKLIRFYLILLEEKLDFKRFVRIYIKTAFVNIVLPLKSGEIFRFYCYSNETNNYKIGLLSILVERFFDTCALLLFIFPLEILVTHQVSSIAVILLLFVLLGFVIYNVFYPIYKYINKFFILNVTSKKSLMILEVLEKQNEWYLYIKKLVKGRFSLVFLLSFLAWTLEYIFVYFISTGLEAKFSLKTFNIYINSGFLGKPNTVLSIYTVLGALVFGITMMIVYSINFKKRRDSDVK